MIRRLITHGCSFTYGEELADPALSSWPKVVADRFGLELLNLAKPAYSNDLIMGDIIDAEINKHSHEDFVIIGWSSYLRVGLQDCQGWYTVRPNARDNLGDRKLINDLLVRNLDLDWLRTRWLQQVIAMQSYLDSIHAPYLFLSAFDNLNGMPKNHPLLNKINQARFVGWPRIQMVDMINGTKLAPRGHPTEPGHVAIANFLLDPLIKTCGMQLKN